jgi:hypothetical protein
VENDDMHKLVFLALTSSESLMAEISGVYDSPQEKAKSPYIMLGTLRESPGPLVHELDTEGYLDVHIWSDYQGKKEVLRLVQLVQEALYDVEGSHYEGMEILQEKFENRRWHHGVTTFRFYLGV